ncbi:MAG: UvrD-helicase domain-containing protein, partial [Streptococcaceae bacterium]|nr:UvrD-helicase domain-containing protein [Streptococcaceae bacterium]
MKKDFELEQNRLKMVYGELLEAKAEAMEVLHAHHEEGMKRMSEMDRDNSLDMSNYADQLDSFAQLEIRNREIDQMNFKYESWSKKLDQVQRLLPKAYFGRIDVEYADEKGIVEEFYLGVNGFVNNEDVYRIYDWRSPVAELYYNQELGKTSYEANDTAIQVDLKRRRQFQVDKDVLNNYFDSAVAIEDELLLHALEGDSTQYMQDITATIQKEQNAIIRDMTSQVLLVNGIAGSGKTSAVLQRIAYLLYQERVNLRAEEVVLFAPN